MAVDPTALRQHLERVAEAYGTDLVLPRGTAVAPPRAAASAPAPPPVAAARAPGAAPAPPAGSPTPPAPRTPSTAGPAAADADAAAALLALRAEVMPCTRCKLHQGRTHAVFGEGNARPEVLFVGEAPGAVEDQTGRPFVGPAGQLLERILAGAMGLQRSDVYIANLNKCRPPGNRNPEPDEVAACLPFLRRQIAILQPRVIVCLGRVAAHNLLGTAEPMRALRGRDLAYEGTPVVVTWHPAYLLRDPSHKRETWDDIKRVNRLLGRPEVPGKTNG
ncbi:MAG: uracil-DNA glycosylase [Planctomycetes bacterium]|nr:uracil-DNA glycosylase [Planctomycetota bacterium]